MSDTEKIKPSAANLRVNKPSAAEGASSPVRPKRLDKLAFPDPAVGNGGPPATIPNVERVLEHEGINVRYNVIKKKIEIIVPGVTGTTDNHDNTALTHVLSCAARHGMAVGQVPAIIEAIADKNPYNPAADWITSRSWDGEDRLPAICDTLVTDAKFPVGLKNLLIRKWLLSCVAAALMPSGFHSRGVLTLQGPQGIGKTSWCRKLVPDPALRETALKLDHHLDGGNKDSILGAITHWIVEIGELDSSFRRDIARLKGFLTNDRDKVRRPYARTEAEYGRRTVFLATVNQSDFLVDHTGNSRWWTLPVEEIDFEHEIDMQQVFAQLAVDFKDGAEWWLNAHEEEELEWQNRKHHAFSAVQDQLSEFVDWDAAPSPTADYVTASDLLRQAGIDQPTNQQAKECAAQLRSHFGDPRRIHGQMKWRVPLRSVTSDEVEDPSHPNYRDD